MRGATQRWGAIIQVASLQLVAGAVAGFSLLDRQARHDTGTLMVAAGPIASATMLSLAALFCFPVLLPGGRLEFPSNVALPVVFALLVRACAILWTSSQSAVFRTADPMLPALIWTRASALVLVAGVQCILMTLWIGLRLLSRR